MTVSRHAVEDDLRALPAVAAPVDFAKLLTLSHFRLNSAIGPLFGAVSTEGLVAVRRVADLGQEDGFVTYLHHAVGLPSLPTDVAPPDVENAVRRLDGTGVSVDLRRLGSFERDVLAAASTIPRGETRSYGWIAREIGRPRAVRAVGTALGKNPVPLVIPCHRVVLSDGSAGQYIFGGAAKRTLLATESGA
jgi:methylated-DNA-[protein]-cysteine S-methyltransferase